MSDTTSTRLCHAMQLNALIDGYQYGALIYVAAKLNLADTISSGTTDSISLAKNLGVAHSPLLRVMRALVAMGFCHEDSDGRFELDEIGCLLLDGPQTLKHKAILAMEQYWSVWSNLLYSVTTGNTAFEHVHGMGPWAYRGRHPEAGTCFNMCLSGETERAAAAIVAAMDVTDISTVADIAGGEGALISSILQAHPRLHGILFDRPGVAHEAKARLAHAGLAQRCDIISGDIFKHIPIKADTYTLKSVLHDWNDEQCDTILKNCRSAMPSGSKLLIIERLLPGRGGDNAAIMLDIHMLLVTGGCERTLEEFTALTRKAGLSLQYCKTTDAGFAIMQCIPI